MTIEFVSNDFSKREIKSKLKKSLENTEILRGLLLFGQLIMATLMIP